jgi:uncharacterized protein (DUF305 family)
MNKIFLVILLFAVAAIGAACDQNATGNSTANNSNANHANMNHAGMDHSNMNHSNMDHSKMDHSKMDHSMMNHSEMKSDPNAASAPYDLQFIDTMIPHHQGAVDMAKMIETRTQNPEMKKFAAQIIADQEKEIAQMKEWREKWFAGAPRAMNMEMPGMKESMDMDMPKLSAAKDKEFDLMFIEMMIPHHAGAVTMSREALQKSERSEIKTLANQIIKAQETEIKMMEDWKKKWAK